MSLPVSIPLTLRVEGIEELTSSVNELRLAFQSQLYTLRLELTTRMATIEEQVAQANAAIDGVTGDIVRIKDELAQALADNQGEINAAVETALSSASTQLQGVVDRLQSLDAQNEPPATPEEPGVPEEPANPEEPAPTPEEPAPEEPVNP